MKNLTNKITNNSYVGKVLSVFLKPLFNNACDLENQVAALNVMMNLFKKFENFDKNENSLIEMKELWFKKFQQRGRQETLQLYTSLNTMINSYKAKDGNYLDFKISIPRVIQQLETRRQQQSQKLENQHIRNNNFTSDFLSDDDSASKQGASPDNSDSNSFSEPFSPVQ